MCRREKPIMNTDQKNSILISNILHNIIKIYRSPSLSAKYGWSSDQQASASAGNLSEISMSVPDLLTGPTIYVLTRMSWHSDPNNTEALGQDTETLQEVRVKIGICC